MYARVSIVVGVALLMACGGDKSTAPKPLNIGGNWNYSESFNSSAAGISCNDQGTVLISQSGTTFTGTVTAVSGACTDQFGNGVPNTGTITISGGQIDGSQISFQTPSCQYNATVSGNPSNALTGTKTCNIALSGTNYMFTGQFQASR